MGFGHITRCTSLYEAFASEKIVPFFIVNGDESVHPLLHGKRHEIFDWINDKEKLFKLIKNADIVIIDSYMADYKLYEDISRVVQVPVYIDDNKRLDYPPGVVVNGNIYAKYMDYPVTAGVEYLLGTEYIMLRREFLDVGGKKIGKDLEKIMVTFGGDDYRNITPNVLDALKTNYPELKITIIIGGGFQHIEDIEKLSSDKTELIYNASADKMRDVMLESDVAISAGGQTLYELSRTGVPTIAIILAANQIRNVKFWYKTGFVICAGTWDDEDLLNRIIESLNDLKDFDLRKEKSKIGKKYVKGNGAHNIIKYCLNKFN